MAFWHGEPHLGSNSGSLAWGVITLDQENGCKMGRFLLTDGDYTILDGI